MVAGLMLVLGAVPAGFAGTAAIAFQGGCSEPADDDALTLFSVTEPAGATAFGEVSGPAPLAVGIAVRQGVIAYPAGFLSTSIIWGDGTAATIAVAPCGEDEYEYAAQTLRHTYAAAGSYQVSWHLQIPTLPLQPIPILLVSVGAQPVATVTPAQAATPTPTTTITATSVAGTPGPTLAAATGTPGASPGAATLTAETPTRTPTRPPGPGTPSPTATTPTPPPSPSPTPTQTALAGAGTGEQDGDDNTPGERPEVSRWLASPGDVSTDADVVVTNVVIAGVTVWVFFSSIFLDEVLSDRRELIESRLRRVTRRLRRTVAAPTTPRSAEVRSAVDVLAVLLITAGVYSFLQPGLELSKAAAAALLAAVAGIAITTLVCDGLQAVAIRRWTGTPAAIRAYPAAIGIAAISVASSRALGLNPGVIYGFVASCTALGPLHLDRRLEGRLSAVPLIAGLLLAVGAWLAVGPVRALESNAFGAITMESMLVVIFIGGIESLAISLIPVAATDGGKVARWSRKAWAGLAVIAAFLTWHVLLGREREYFSGLRQAASLTVIAVFLVYSALVLALWLWLRRKAP